MAQTSVPFQLCRINACVFTRIYSREQKDVFGVRARPCGLNLKDVNLHRRRLESPRLIKETKAEEDERRPQSLRGQEDGHGGYIARLHCSGFGFGSGRRRGQLEACRAFFGTWRYTIANWSEDPQLCYCGAPLSSKWKSSLRKWQNTQHKHTHTQTSLTECRSNGDRPAPGGPRSVFTTGTTSSSSTSGFNGQQSVRFTEHHILHVCSGLP